MENHMLLLKKGDKLNELKNQKNIYIYYQK